MTRTRRWALLGGGAGLAVCAAIWGVFWILDSAWLRQQIQARVVREIAAATGGKVALAAVEFDWRAMRLGLRGLVVHGLEPPEAPPLASVGRITIGLKLVSAVRRKIDVESIVLEHPRVNVTVDSNGKTNIPSPPVERTTGSGVERLFDMAVRQYAIHDGAVTYNGVPVPVHAEGRGLDASMTFDPAAKAYDGALSVASLRLTRPLPLPLDVGGTAEWRLENERLARANADLRAAGSWMRVAVDGTPLGAASWGGRFDGNVSLPEAAKAAAVRWEHGGTASVGGRFHWHGSRDWSAEGNVKARDLVYAARGVEVRPITAESMWRASPKGAELTGLRASALGGQFNGAASVDGWNRLRASGSIEGFALDRLAAAGNRQSVAWGATVSGPVEVEGPAVRLAARLTLTPNGRGIPLSGEVSADYDEAARLLRFGPSHLEFPSSRLHFSGDAGQRVAFGVFSRDLNDFSPALGRPLPVKLESGSARFEGAWTGGMDNGEVRGHFEAGPLAADGQRADDVRGDVEASASGVKLRAFRARRGTLLVEGELAAQLAGWNLTDTSSLGGRVRVRDVPLADALRLAGSSLAATGTLQAQMDISGSYGAPRAAGHAVIDQLQAWDEQFGRLETDVRYSKNAIELAAGRVRDGAITFEGAIENARDIRFRTESAHTRLSQWNALRTRQRDIEGDVSWKLSGAARLTGKDVELASLEGEARVGGISVAGRPVGEARLSARTEGKLVRATLEARLRESRIAGDAEWSLTGPSYGLGQVRANRVSFADLQEVGLLGEPGKELAFRGFFNGEAGFAGPILKPERWTGAAKITTLEVEPNRKLPRIEAGRFVLRNREPLVAYVDAAGLTLQAVHLVAEGTDLEAKGSIAFRAKSPWNLEVKGRLNLPALSSFEPDLVASGVSTIDAAVRGPFERPHIFGRMEIRDASFNMRGLPNGIDKANGTIVFDRTRANIERFTGLSGGGELALNGFVGFGGDELHYRLNALVQKIRVRYPEAVSTTFNANINLSGTATRSLLGGTVTVSRIALHPQSDIGSLLAEAGRSTPAVAAPNDFLRGMQIDMRLETSPDAELQTSLARDVTPEASLHLQGSALKPVVLGRVSVNQGEIRFFGNQYSITRGDVSFFNPAKIDPVLDLDLETRIRGVTVNINFTGPMDRLAVSYRSDPPLQSSEIVALLTVGRAPGSGITPDLPGRAGGTQTLVQSSNNTLLGQAISAPITGRLERLFGVSRIKIDPDLTGVTNTPQARLTVEQQLSRDITLTYITNLNRTQQQIVRLQWDWSRDFSVLAVRDENGVFGVDFLWRKRFK